MSGEKSNQETKKQEEKRITSLKRMTKEKKTVCFSKPLKIFQTAQQIILSFNCITKSHRKLEKRFKVA